MGTAVPRIQLGGKLAAAQHTNAATKMLRRWASKRPGKLTPAEYTVMTLKIKIRISVTVRIGSKTRIVRRAERLKSSNVIDAPAQRAERAQALALGWPE